MTAPSTPTADPRYPPIEPYAHGFLSVDSGHKIFWETCGNPRGLPALFLHGGPGGGCSESNRRLFDPARFRIVLIDQRGCGRSTPAGSLESNTTAHLINDIEVVRGFLKIDRWLLLGGSWGATLALAYAQQFPQHVKAMVLRAVFTARQSELAWLYQGGAAKIFPEAWPRFANFIPEVERGDLLAAYHARLTCGDLNIETTAARAWCLWEDAIASMIPGPFISDTQSMCSLARIETHYFINHAFIDEGKLIRNAIHLQNIPAVIVQGRYDMVTPPVTAWELHHAWPGSRLQIVEDAGHVSSEAGIARELISATYEFAKQFAADQIVSGPSTA